MPGSASLFHMHALLESDYAILTYICTFLVCAVAQSREALHNVPTLNTSWMCIVQCACLNGNSILVTA